MTNAEKQEIIEAVLAALATNSVTIPQLSPKQSLEDSDQFEVAGGSRVTYLVLKNGIREGLALASQLNYYVTSDQAMMYLAKLDTETGTIDFKESPCVMLDGFKDVNGYSPATGDLFYENSSNYQIWTKTQGGATGEHANTHVAYINRNENAIYRWTGTTMERIGGCAVVNDLTTGGGDKALSAEMGPLLKSNINTVQANIVKLYNKLANMAFWDATDQAAAEPTPLDWQVPDKTLTIINSIEHAVVTRNGEPVGSSINVSQGETVELIVAGTTGFNVTSVTASSGTATNLGNGTFKVVVTVNNDTTLALTGTTAVKTYSISYNLTGCEAPSGVTNPTTIQHGGTATIQLEATNGVMPASLPSGSVTGATASYTRDSEDITKATIVLSNPTDSVSVVVVVVVVPEVNLIIKKLIVTSKENSQYFIQSGDTNMDKRACLLVNRSEVQNPCTWGNGVPGLVDTQAMSTYTTIPIPSGATKASLQCNSAYSYGLTLVGSDGYTPTGYTIEWTAGSTKKTVNFADWPTATHIVVNFKHGAPNESGVEFVAGDTYDSMQIDFKFE